MGKSHVSVCAAHTGEVDVKLLSVNRYLILRELFLICVAHVCATDSERYCCCLSVLHGHERIVKVENHDATLVAWKPIREEGVWSCDASVLMKIAWGCPFEHESAVCAIDKRVLAS